MSSKMRKKPHFMIYYLIFDEDKHYIFCNKSTSAKTSVRHHFHRSQNPSRADYSGDFYTWLRSRPEEEFIVTYCTEMPECIDKRAHLTTLPPNAVLPPVITYEELYERLCNDNTR